MRSKTLSENQKEWTVVYKLTVYGHRKIRAVNRGAAIKEVQDLAGKELWKSRQDVKIELLGAFIKGDCA